MNSVKMQLVDQALLRSLRDKAPEMAIRCLLNGADANVVDERGESALHLAARIDSLRLISELLSRGADRSAINRAGATPFEIAKGGLGRMAKMRLRATA
jgi:ankyrin repeat protein